MCIAMTIFQLFFSRLIGPRLKVTFIFQMEISSYILLDKLNSKMMSYFAKILIIDKNIRRENLSCNYLSTTVGSSTFEMVYCSWLFKKLFNKKKFHQKGHTQYVSSAAVKKLHFPSTWYMETTILNVSNVIQFCHSSKHSLMRVFTV